MLKKVTAYSLILIASFALLAHAVIPHHHHQLFFCVEQSHSVDDDAAPHNCTVPEHDHHHNGNTSATDCVLGQAVAITTSQGKLFKSYDAFNDSYQPDFFILPNFRCNELQTAPLVVATVPEFSPLISSFVTLTFGLRAPPMV